MTAAPILPIESLANAIGPGSAVGGASGGATVPGASPELAHKFQELMQRSASDGASDASPGSHAGPNALTRVVDAEKSDFQRLDDMNYAMIEHTADMSPMESVGRLSEIMEQVTTLNIKTSLASGTTKASNKALDSLLKNQ